MENFSGFSTEDIEQYSNLEIVNETDKEIPTKCKRTPKRSDKIAVSSLNNHAHKNLTKGFSKKKSLVTNYEPIPPEARLKQPAKSSSHEDNGSNSSLEISSSISSHSSVSQNQSDETSSIQSGGTNTNAVTILVGDDKSYEVISTVSTEGSPIKNSTSGDGEVPQKLPQRAFLLERDDDRCDEESPLKLFHERQKQMEELNNRRKELLTKAIADRKRQTQFEAKKLLQIQEELNRLDALLSTDVGILRNQIELASYEFNEAQKRYDKAESEFIEAKLQLFSKLERKELLTEHLCRIIEVNEQRKAKKLSELMAKLELTEEGASTDLISEESAITPESIGLNEIMYTVCSTLKNPARSKISDCSAPGSHLSREVSVSAEGEATASKSCVALNSVNLTTAQNLDQRSEGVPCDLNSSVD